MHDLKKIYLVSQTVRKAIDGFSGIEEDDEWDKDINLRFRNFPIEGCEEASAFLANILKNKYSYNNIKIVRASLKNLSGYHTWVKIDDIDIDITSDQFEECNEKVVVAKRSKFHLKKFKIINDWEGEIKSFRWPKNREKYYKELLKTMTFH